MRKAQSYPCPFCNVTSEKRATAQEHAEKHVALLNRRIQKREAQEFVSILGRQMKGRMMRKLRAAKKKKTAEAV